MKLLKLSLLVLVINLFSCKSKPKVIVEDTQGGAASTTAPVGAATGMTGGGDMHQVKAVEILQADRYSYIKVSENGGEPFWIATAKLDAKVGNEYFYRGGLLKTDFESVEHKRVFDKIFLVSEIIDAAAHPGSNGTGEIANEAAPVSLKDIKDVPGAIKLNVVLGEKDKYNGKVITVAGKVVKANYGIMNKNWFHIQDGTKKDGKLCDLTITSTENIPLGAAVAFQGKLYLDKDFGAGYKYDIIMEEASPLK
ncbi:hypothetical protein EGI22_12585 [Lacihabitans sp. LS3-19]|uniref:GW dipeptide domain-containing protein n=1 Tax=Lacihabitans sp. LS3-19 TaxID=2487335 RepID=UPI0020CFBA7B|nr:GW dipeptide domain-containing protein [Lacihabitans sp. LS3-19]MCP9768755.1 hypothetical protein [Lacihabitans sp. LS3-19]